MYTLEIALLDELKRKPILKQDKNSTINNQYLLPCN